MHSHVLPEFFYSASYGGDKQQFVSISRHPHHPTRRFQKGYRERRLCQGCESLLSRYETASAKTLRNILALAPDEQKVIAAEYDSPSFRLFGLSILWRMHVSTLFQFQKVDLGPHAEEIRQLLNEEDPKNPVMYPFFLMRVTGSKSAERTIIAPVPFKISGRKGYVLLAMGFNWIFCVSSDCAGLERQLPFVGTTEYLLVPVRFETDSHFLSQLAALTSRWGK